MSSDSLEKYKFILNKLIEETQKNEFNYTNRQEILIEIRNGNADGKIFYRNNVNSIRYEWYIQSNLQFKSNIYYNGVAKYQYSSFANDEYFDNINNIKNLNDCFQQAFILKENFKLIFDLIKEKEQPQEQINNVVMSLSNEKSDCILEGTKTSEQLQKEIESLTKELEITKERELRTKYLTPLALLKNHPCEKNLFNTSQGLLVLETLNKKLHVAAIDINDNKRKYLISPIKESKSFEIYKLSENYIVEGTVLAGTNFNYIYTCIFDFYIYNKDV